MQGGGQRLLCGIALGIRPQRIGQAGFGDILSAQGNERLEQGQRTLLALARKLQGRAVHAHLEMAERVDVKRPGPVVQVQRWLARDQMAQPDQPAHEVGLDVVLECAHAQLGHDLVALPIGINDVLALRKLHQFAQFRQAGIGMVRIEGQFGAGQQDRVGNDAARIALDPGFRFGKQSRGSGHVVVGGAGARLCHQAQTFGPWIACIVGILPGGVGMYRHCRCVAMPKCENKVLEMVVRRVQMLARAQRCSHAFEKRFGASLVVAENGTPGTLRQQQKVPQANPAFSGEVESLLGSFNAAGKVQARQRWMAEAAHHTMWLSGVDDTFSRDGSMARTMAPARTVSPDHHV